MDGRPPDRYTTRMRLSHRSVLGFLAGIAAGLVMGILFVLAAVA